MKTNKEQIYDFIKLHASAVEGNGVSTQYVAETLGIFRTNVSSILNLLVGEGRVNKTNGRPVLYFIPGDKTIPEDKCFENLKGFNGSLKQQIQLAKAAIVYPGRPLNTLITGEQGTGKSLLVLVMHQYAIASGVMPKNATLEVIDCKDYQGDEVLFFTALFGDDGSSGCYKSAGCGILHIDNAHLLSAGLRSKVCSAIGQRQHNEGEFLTKPEPMVIVTCDAANKSACGELAKLFPIVIELSPLSERPLEERMAMIQGFLTLEAARAKRTLTINAELLRCLLLYECTNYNIMQLKTDIKRGCATAYLRERGDAGDKLSLYISDFDHHVRKGFLNYNKHRKEIERIIPADYNYSFSESTMQMSAIDRAKLKSESLYDEIDRKVQELSARGMTEEEINLFLCAEFETIYRQYWNNALRQIVNKEQLIKLVDKRVIELVEEFLDEVSLKLSKSFPPSVFYGLCLHVDSVIKGNTVRQALSNRQMTSIVENNKAEYSLSLQFAAKIEEVFSVTLPVDEIVLIAMFLFFEDPATDMLQKPVILLAFHGDRVAGALADMINSMVKCDNVFSSEVPFEQEPSDTYKALMECVKRIERGRGVIALYDMEYLSAIFDAIADETGIEIRTVQLPITLIGIEWSRRAAIAGDVDTLYRSVMTNLDPYMKPSERVIVTLCTTGEGGAAQLKDYIAQYGCVDNMKIVPLTITDRGLLKNRLIELQKDAVIHCIVGTFDPNLLGIPFIPVSEVLGCSPDMLPEVLKFKNREKSRIDLNEVFSYLSEQLEYVNIKKLKRMLPDLIEQINANVAPMSLDTEIGLLMHIACCLNRMAGKERIPVNIRREQIIKSYDAQYRELRRIIKPFERAFGLIVPDDEMANIIMIIYKL